MPLATAAALGSSNSSNTLCIAKTVRTLAARKSARPFLCASQFVSLRSTVAAVVE